MCAMAQHQRLDSVLSFSRGGPGADADRPTADEEADAAGSDGDDDSSDAGFEFAFAPPLRNAEGGALFAPADDLFAHGRIVPAYPVFDRRLVLPRDELAAAAPQPQGEASTAPPSPDTYCAWAPRSAPGSPARDAGPFPKSASTGEARRFWRLRGLVAGGGGGRSHSDGKEKFVFLQPAASASAAPSSRMSPPVVAKATPTETTKKPSSPPQHKQSKTKRSSRDAAAATEMDMATAHRLFYGKQGAGALAGDRKQQHSYLPYRPGIVGFFASAHALGRSHHPY